MTSPGSQPRTWFVRAGRRATRIREFLDRGFVTLGWDEVRRVHPSMSAAELQAAFREAYPDARPGALPVWAGMLLRFVRDVQPGDHVVTYDPHRQLYFLGVVTASEVVEMVDRLRRVQWTHEVSRRALEPATLRTLGSITAFFEVNAAARADLWRNAQSRE